MPSRTAWAAAAHRATHQLLDHGRIFEDPLAVRVLGEDPHAITTDAEQHPSRRLMRTFIAVRHRFAEDTLRQAVDRGTTQLVVLGAGLDTCAYRVRDPRLRVFEVDHPDTQAWKRERLHDAGIEIPQSLTFTPVNFERERLDSKLHAAGLDPQQQTFFMWLGVVPYLTSDAIWATLRFIAGFAAGSHVVFDYAEPPELMSAEARAAHEQRAQHVAARGEPWLTYFAREELHDQLVGVGFNHIEDMGPREIASRFIPSRAATAPERGGHVLRASTRAPGE